MNEKPVKDFSQLVAEQIGRASMCWSETPKGIFEAQDASNCVDEIVNAHNKEIEKLQEENKKLRDALSFYANKNNWECGQFGGDLDAVYSSETYLTGGKLARQTLASLEGK